MLSPALDKQRRQLFAQAAGGMEQRLAKVNEPTAMLAALDWGMQQIDRALAETPAKVRATVACRAGCAHCCSVPVDVQAHEVFFTAEHIQVNSSPVNLAGVIEHTGAHRSRVATLGSDERTRLRQTCALLREGQCSLYARRRVHRIEFPIHTHDKNRVATDSGG